MRVDPDAEAARAQAARMLLQRADVSRDQTAAGAVERFRVERSELRELLVVVADEELQRRTGSFGEPGRTLERRLVPGRGVEDDEGVSNPSRHH